MRKLARVSRASGEAVRMDRSSTEKDCSCRFNSPSSLGRRFQQGLGTRKKKAQWFVLLVSTLTDRPAFVGSNLKI